MKIKENVLVEQAFNSPFERVEVYNVDIQVPRKVPPSDTVSSKVLKLSYKLRVGSTRAVSFILTFYKHHTLSTGPWSHKKCMSK